MGKKVNRILSYQEKLYDEMNKLCDDEHMKIYGKKEVSRSQALTQNAGAYLKSINTQLNIKKSVNNNAKKEKELLEDMGVIAND